MYGCFFNQMVEIYHLDDIQHMLDGLGFATHSYLQCLNKKC